MLMLPTDYTGQTFEFSDFPGRKIEAEECGCHTIETRPEPKRWAKEKAPPRQTYSCLI